MFMGEYRHNLDAKGRLTMPSKFRNQCGDYVVVTLGFDGCLSVYTPEAWEVFYQKLLQLPSSKKDTRAYVRLLASKATDAPFDKMGRISIPQTLRQRVSIEKNCVIVGNLDHMEIWDEATWDAYYDEKSSQLETLSEALDFDF